MLTIKEIKQAVEFADGFELHDCDGMHKIEYILECSAFRVNIQTMHPNHLPNYDLFLDRVVQGMFRADKGKIIYLYNKICGRFSTSVFEFHHEESTEGIREARENAIRFVLEEME